MKKEIERLINSDNAMININRYCRLERWTRDAVGNEVDKLAVIFSITHVNDFTAEITARDWKGVVAEIRSSIAAAFSKAASEYAKQLDNGYLPNAGIHEIL